MSRNATAAHGDSATRSMESALRARVDAEVRFDDTSRALYATDGSNYRQIPIGVVVPRTVDAIAETIAVCREHDAPVLMRGGGTSLAGQCCNVAVVIDTSKYLDRVLEIDPESRTALVEPGCVLDTLRAAAEQHHLTFGPDPSTHDHNCLGGMIGNNSCGVHSVMAGRTADNVEALEIVTYEGERGWVGRTDAAEFERIVSRGGALAAIYQRLRALASKHAAEIRERYPAIPRRVSGYNLDELLPERGFQVARALVGSEGTCVAVLRARLRLVPSPPGRQLLVLGFPDVYQAADHVPTLLDHEPIGLEGMDERLIQFREAKRMKPPAGKLLPDGCGWLLVEFGGETREEAREKANAALAALENAGAPGLASRMYDDPQDEHKIWEIRKSGLGATADVPGMAKSHPGWEDAAVAPGKVGAYLRDFRALLDRYDYGCSMYGHFGDGCIHVRIDFDLRTHEGTRRMRRFVEEAADLVLRYGGSFSGEHGDGQSRGVLLPKLYGDSLVAAMREFKSIWDPRWRMNPGKVIDAYDILDNLRAGPQFSPPEQRLDFAYPNDGRSLERVALRCVGVGSCRRASGTFMCPSYQATREEMHSTRGRARLLYEMLAGMQERPEPIRDGWRSDGVREALDLCLACKACKSDCPVNIDMASYKADFMHRYYRGRRRPRAAYSLGLIYWWARAAQLAPRVANAVVHTPGLNGLVKRAAGIAPARSVPRFAARSFRRRFGNGSGSNRAGRRVLLWPDTFTNYFEPHILEATVAVLDRAGYAVQLPDRPLCCGRPLYAEGMLDTARHQLTAIMDALEPLLDHDVPIVGVEPACMAAFREELPALFPDDPRARALAARAHLLDEFLVSVGYEPDVARGRALVQFHCNHHAIFDPAEEKKLLAVALDEFEEPNHGCCGMAGSFGYDADKYDVSVAIADAALTPAVRQASPDTLIIADGFACRDQIRQLTGRRALHLAEVLARREH